MPTLPQPYLLFLGAARDLQDVKTAAGIAQWRPEQCVAEYGLPGCAVSVGQPRMTPGEAAAAGARSMVIGTALFGGRIQDDWIAPICEALEAGLDIVGGTHVRLGSVDQIRAAAERAGRSLHDVRHLSATFPVASGRKRSGKRLLTVGTDCAPGKKYTALAIERAFLTAGLAATFRATGQTGIMIAGAGVAIDAVVADFIAGAAESLSPDNDATHWDVIEGQGSLFHPAYAGVSLGLLHGSQPDAMVLCDEPVRQTMDGYPGFAKPDLMEAMDLHLAHARRVNRDARFVGVSLNTSRLAPPAADAMMAELSGDLGLPVFDPLRSDLGPLVKFAAG